MDDTLSSRDFAVLDAPVNLLPDVAAATLLDLERVGQALDALESQLLAMSPER